MFPGSKSRKYIYLKGMRLKFHSSKTNDEAGNSRFFPPDNPLVKDQLQLVEAAWLEQRVHWWRGSQICYTRAPSASWHRGLAGKTCGPELGVGLLEGTGLCLQSWRGWGTRQERDSIFKTRQSAHLWNNSWCRQG